MAVVTGAASGIGHGLARHCAKEAMKVVLGDIAADRLRAGEQEMQADGHQVLAVKCDVSRYEEVEQLAAKTIASWSDWGACRA